MYSRIFRTTSRSEGTNILTKFITRIYLFENQAWLNNCHVEYKFNVNKELGFRSKKCGYFFIIHSLEFQVNQPTQDLVDLK